MKNKKHFRIFSVMLAAVVCLCGFAVTVYANGNDHREAEQTQPTETNTAPQSLTPEGNMTIVDDISGDAENQTRLRGRRGRKRAAGLHRGTAV